MSFKGRGPIIRCLAAAGRTPEEIADLYGFDPAAVASFLETRGWRDRPRMERSIRAQTAARVRELIDQRWSAARIARELDLDPARVREFARRLEPARVGRLAIPRTRPEQARLERSRRKARDRARAREKAAAERAARWVDEWRTAAVDDERYRDPTTPAAAPPRPAADLEPEPEPVDPVEAVAGDPPPRTNNWSDPDDARDRSYARGESHGNARLTEDQVRTIRAEHAAGRGLKELAGVYGVHRQTIFMITARRTWTHLDDSPAPT